MTLNEEAQAFRWMSEPDALTLNLNQPTRTLLDAVATGEPEPIDA